MSIFGEMFPTSSAQSKALLKANAVRTYKDAICIDMPEIYDDEFDLSTTISSTLRDFYNEPMSEWDDFNKETLTWFNSKETQDAFSRCGPFDGEGVIDRVWRRKIQGQWSLVDIFKFHATIPAIDCFKAMGLMKTLSGPGKLIQNVKIVDAGDAEERPFEAWVSLSLRSDLVLTLITKFEAGSNTRKHEIRFLIEAKSGKIVNLCALWDEATKGNHEKLKNILGELISDMVDHETKYGVFTTYGATVFLKIESHAEKEIGMMIPHVYVSKAIKFDDDMGNNQANDEPIISLRLAMLYLLYLTSQGGSTAWTASGSIHSIPQIGDVSAWKLDDKLCSMMKIRHIRE